MAGNWTVDVHAGGAIRLSPDVSCDGFLQDTPIRIQSHIHRDHLQGFDKCKGVGRTIICRHGTRDLMIAADDSGLHRRSNFVSLDDGGVFETETGAVSLWDSNHMLGSAQVMFEAHDGYRTGYSGDFGWPTTPIEVDELVLDGTVSPRTVRQYSQETAEEVFVDLVLEKIGEGPLVISGDAEARYRTMGAVSEIHSLTVVADHQAFQYAQVYRQYGLSLPSTFLSADSEEGKAAMENDNYLFFRSKNARSQYDRAANYVNLIPFYTPSHKPLIELAPNSFEVGISNHADFDETLEYVKASGASRILIDHVRGRRAVELALAIVGRLAIQDVDYFVTP